GEYRSIREEMNANAPGLLQGTDLSAWNAMRRCADDARTGLKTFRSGLYAVTRLVDGLENPAQKTMAVKSDQASREAGSEEMEKGRGHLLGSVAGYDTMVGALVGERNAFLSTSYRSQAMSRQQRAMSYKRAR